ncbi:hypothetical protein [Pseudoalteromonas sp. CO342X]|uniref:hypothetical protein n=1 Tax=Pseudoalteromonas sp. CO342X TaxID=1777270 RepID=UPI00197FE550|nr:hypothetical protein [Pseudoalteromonas sp. CO342X]
MFEVILNEDKNKKPEEFIELDPHEWMFWDDEQFNEWRRLNDYPRIVQFLENSLPKFNNWLLDQSISIESLLYHGPARFVRYYGQRINYIEYEENYPFGVKKVLHRFIVDSDLIHEPEGKKIQSKTSFFSYFDWAINEKISDIEDIIFHFTPRNRTSAEADYTNSSSNITLNIPRYMPDISMESLMAGEAASPPRLELLKLGGKGVAVEQGLIGLKNLEFTNLDNLVLASPVITSYQQLLFCTLRNFKVVGDLHAATFYQSVAEIAVSDGKLANCSFEYGETEIKKESFLFKCRVKEEKFALSASELTDCQIEYSSIVKFSQTLKKAFHHDAKIAYSRLGYPDIAGEHFFLEQKAKRASLWHSFIYFDSKRNFKTELLSLLGSSWMYLQELYWGYGERPFNIIKSVTFILITFALINYSCNQSSTYSDISNSLLYTVQSFTNIKVVDIKQESEVLNLIGAILSLCGLLSVGLLVASLSAKSRKYN